MAATRPSTPDEYIASLPEERRKPVAALRRAINENIPDGFSEGIAYNMIGWVVPHSIFPAGYHCDPTKPLMLMSLASQKGYISLHHLGLYTGVLLDWFTEAWKQATPRKLDMGKACVRFKKMDEIPYELIGELASRLTPEQWVQSYQQALARKKA